MNQDGKILRENWLALVQWIRITTMMRLLDLRSRKSVEGITSAALGVLRQTFGRLFWIERIAFYILDLKPILSTSASPAGIDFVVPNSDELLVKYAPQLEVNFHLERWKVLERLSRSHHVALAVCENAVVAMVWLSFTEQEVSEIDRILVLQPHEVLTYNELTLPAWRGKGISPALNEFADEFASQRKVVRRITWRRISNAPAIRVAEKLGHKRIAVVTTACFASRWRPIVLGLDADSGLEFRRR